MKQYGNRRWSFGSPGGKGCPEEDNVRDHNWPGREVISESLTREDLIQQKEK
jgi:hypothetical protein